MGNTDFIKRKFERFDESFYQEMREHGIFTSVDAKQELISEGEKVKFIPFLIKGSVKVYNLHDGKELVYYYISPGESCIMTFSTIFTDKVSRIYAISEEKSDVLLLPVSQFLIWLQKYPKLNQMFFLEYDSRYKFMMETINKIVFQKLDHRVLEYLHERTKRSETQLVKVSHKKIADELGTAREVVSRILKKFEREGLITQSPLGIGIIEKR